MISRGTSEYLKHLIRSREQHGLLVCISLFHLIVIRGMGGEEERGFHVMR